jgi:hypothetical protein
MADGRWVVAGAANKRWRVDGEACADGGYTAIGNLWRLLVVMQGQQYPWWDDLSYAQPGECTIGRYRGGWCFRS